MEAILKHLSPQQRMDDGRAYRMASLNLDYPDFNKADLMIFGQISESGTISKECSRNLGNAKYVLENLDEILGNAVDLLLRSHVVGRARELHPNFLLLFDCMHRIYQKKITDFECVFISRQCEYHVCFHLPRTEQRIPIRQTDGMQLAWYSA